MLYYSQIERGGLAMATDDVNQRIEDSALGGRQTKPDERRQYMGSLRERVFLAITVGQLADPAILNTFTQHCADYQGYTALLNGKVSNSIMGDYMKALNNKNVPFTLVNDPDTPADAAAMGVLIVAKDAINRSVINIKDLFPDTTTKPAEKKHKGFFESLF
jgi:uncharacterized protein YueI